MTIVAGHLSYFLIALAYLLRDIRWLRFTALAASGFSIFYHYIAPAEPLWIPIGWNFLFVAINIHHLGQLLKKPNARGLCAAEIDLARTFFHGATPQQASKLFRSGNWRQLSKGDVLAQQGKPCDYVAVLYEGEVQIMLDGRASGRIDKTTFVGEISLLTGDDATATVIVTKPTTALVWRKQQLRKLLDADESLNAQFQRWLAIDLAGKLHRHDGELHWAAANG